MTLSTTDAPEDAREYLRVSEDQTGRLRSPAEQHADNAKAAAGNGWRLGEPYAEDVAVSASRYSLKARVAFDRLCRDLETGAFAARVLILWESSRGSRKVGEWVSLIEACEDAAVRIHVTSHGRTYDPANHRDRRSLLEDAVDSEYESAKSSERLRRAFAAAAAEGRPGGRVPYGYRRAYDPATRRLVSQDPDPDEAPVIAELYERLAAGESLKSVARDFAARGVVTRGSKGYPPRPFSAQHLRNLALRPCYGGLRVHQPVTGPRRLSSADGAVEGTWTALTDSETWHSVHAMLTDPARRKSRPGRGVHLLSLIAVCECGEYLRARGEKDQRRYQCRGRGCVTIRADALDRWADALICHYAARDDVRAMLLSTGDRSPELRAVRADLARARDELAGWRSRAAAGRVSPESFEAIEPGVQARIAVLREREFVLSAPAELGWLLAGPAEETEARWTAAPVGLRRHAARLLLSPAHLGTLTLHRSPVRRRTVAAGERVTLDDGR